MNDPQARPARPALPSLPLEILHMIVWHLEQDYVESHSSGIFDLMRANRFFRDMAFAAHFKKADYRLAGTELFDKSGCEQKNTEENCDKNALSQDQIRLMLWDEHWARMWETRSRRHVRGWTHFMCHCLDAPSPMSVRQRRRRLRQGKCHSYEECARRSGHASPDLSGAVTTASIGSSSVLQDVYYPVGVDGRYLM